MNLFIDLGCYDGTTTDNFLKINPDYFAIGLDPLRFDEWIELKNKYGKRIKFFNLAAWIYDGKVDFSKIDYVNNTAVSSSIVPQKRGYEKGKIYKIKCIDFSQYLKQFEGNYIIVRMNIEGAEIELLENLIKTKAIKLVNELQVEWHSGKIIGIKGGYDERRIEIQKKLNELGVSWTKIGR